MNSTSRTHLASIQRMRLVWGVPLALAVVAGCVGDIGDGGGLGSATAPLCADTPFVRRLTVAEYASTIAAALNVDISAEAVAQVPPDLRTDGFSNTAGSLIVTLDHVEQYELLAQLAVSQVNVSAFAGALVDCSDLSDACAEELIDAFGRIMYRDVPNEDEVAILKTIFIAVADEAETFELAATHVLEAMLQSPRFIYRVENEVGDGNARRLGGYAMASRLSYLLWGASPDEVLYSAAINDALATDEQVEAQVRRMLDDPRARDTSRRYVRDWLDLDRLDNVQRDAVLFPDWDPQLGRDMKEATLAFWDYLVWEQTRPMADLFDAQITFATPALASHYGLSSPGADGSYDTSALAERGGLLTQGMMAAVGGNESSMVSRGLFMLKTFLCGSIGSPPPGVDTTPPDVEPGNTQRVYSEGRVDNPACGGCHSRMEPLAWGLERFDATGLYQLQDSFGNELLEDGIVEFGDGAPQSYTTTAELGDLLAQSPIVQACLGTKASQFAVGRPVDKDSTLTCSVDQVHQQFVESGGTYQDLMVAVALSPMFRNIHTQAD
jgi:hypothetical protein